MHRIVFEKLPQRYVMFTIDVILYICNMLCKRSLNYFYPFFSIGAMLRTNPGHPHVKEMGPTVWWVTTCHNIGTVISLMPVGVYIDKKGSQFCYFLGAMVSGLSTMALAFMGEFGSWEGLLLSRVIFGFSQGFYLGGLVASLSDWVLPKNRNFFIAFLFGAADLSRIINILVRDGVDLDEIHVNTVFIVYGAGTFILSIVALLFRYNDAMVHPYLSIKERIKFVKYYDKAEKYRNGVIPVLDIVKNIHVLGYMIGSVGGAICSSVAVHYTMNYLNLHSKDQSNYE